MNYPQIKPSLNLDFSNTKTLDPRINFRRGTPGAYYDGKTYAKAEENLLSYSEDFSQWGFGRIVQTPAQSAPGGSSGAYKIEQESGQTSSGYLLQTYTTSANKSYTFSVYAKAGTNRNYVVLRAYLSNNRFTYFDLVNGEVVNIDDRHVATIQDAGDGWYRCSITYTPVTSSNVQFNVYFSDNDSSINVTDDGGFIYLWGAQLEQRDSLTAYTPTNGTPITKYQPQLMFASPDQPRFDHDALTGESKGLLIEESRTNLIPYSEDISHFNQQNVLIGHNAMVAPDGTMTADKLIANASSVSHNRVYSNNLLSSSTDGANYTLSFYAKKGEHHHIFATLWDNTGGTLPDSQVWFNLLTGEFNLIKGLSANMEELDNGWYRCSVSSINDSSTNANSIRIQLGGAGEGPSSLFQGDGYSGIYIWGAQLEEGSFATSYIKTSGASATRSADNASITGENFSSWYRQDEGSVYVDSAKGNLGTNFAGYVSLHTEDFSNSEYYWLLHNSSDQFQFLVAPGIANLTDGIDVSLGSQKACVSWVDDNFSMSVNGGEIQSDTSGPAKKNLAGLRIGFSPYSNSHYLNSAIRKIAYYPQRLTNEQLQQLTK